MASGKRLQGAVALLLVPWLGAWAARDARDEVEPAERSLASSLGMAVYPSREPGTPEEMRDQGDCYAWAMARTGSDPLGLSQESGDPAAMTAPETTMREPITGGIGRLYLNREVTGQMGRATVRTGVVMLSNVGALLREARDQGLVNEEAQELLEAQGPSKQRTDFEREFGTCLEQRDYTVSFSRVASSRER